MSAPRISLVCFDIGGVLLRICRTFDQAVLRAGITPHPLAPADPAHLQRRAQISELYQRGRLTTQLFVDRICATFDNRYSIDQLLRIHDAWLIEEYPRVSHVIDGLRSAGVTAVALSNTNQRHFDAFSRFPALTRLNTIYASHHLGLHKPDAEIYLELQRKTSTPPREILFFDDLPENIHAAQSAGWNAVLIDHAADTAGQILASLHAFNVLHPGSPHLARSVG